MAIDSSDIKLVNQARGASTADQALLARLQNAIKKTQGQLATAEQTKANLAAEEQALRNPVLTPEQKYFGEKVGTTGKTQGQIDAARQAQDIASSINSYVNPQTGDVVKPAPQDNTGRQSAYDLLYSQFKQYGLQALVEPLKGLITDAGVSPSEFTIRLRDTDAYKKRFAANQSRIQKGLTALNESEYLGLEDAYQSLMRQYGLPASYYTKGELGRQEGFEKLIANDVSATELEDRIATAQQRVLNTNPEVLQALRQFYPDLNNADILAYTLDPEKALSDIKRKVTAAEIGGAALAQGLSTGQASAEALAGYGITKQQAQQGYQDIASILPRGSQLGSIYSESYSQADAEKEIFNTAGAAEASKKRRKLTALEEAAFGGSSGIGALGKDSSPYRQQTYGAGQY